MMGYPPAENLMAVYVSCGDEELLEKGCHYLKEYRAAHQRKQLRFR